MQSSGNFVRVRLKVSTQLEECGTGDSIIWFLVNKRKVRTIAELELKLAEHLGIRSRYWCNSKLLQLWLDDGLLPKYESVHILQNGDTIRVIVDNTTPTEVHRNSRSQNSSNLHKVEAAAAAAASTQASSHNSRCSVIPKEKTSETSNAALSLAVDATQQQDRALDGCTGCVDDLEFVIKLEPQSGDEDTFGDVEASSEDEQGLQIAAVYSIPAVGGPSTSVDSDASRLIPCPSSAATELDSRGKEMLPDIISTESIPHVPWHRAVRNVKPSAAGTVARSRPVRHDVWSTPVCKRKHGCKSYACLRCNKQFTSPYHLQAHAKWIHSTQQRYFCSHCKASFRVKHEFRRHTKVHERSTSHRRSSNTALQPRTLSVLPSQRNQMTTETKTAARITRLQASVSISRQTRYLGQKRRPLLCQKCNRRFVHKGHLTLHMRWMHAERYCCQYCGLMILSVDWKSHMLLHAASKTVTVSIADLKLGAADFESARDATVQSKNVLQGPRSKLTNDMKISLQSFWNAGTRSWKLNQQTGSLTEPPRQLT